MIEKMQWHKFSCSSQDKSEQFAYAMGKKISSQEYLAWLGLQHRSPKLQKLLFKVLNEFGLRPHVCNVAIRIFSFSPQMKDAERCFTWMWTFFCFPD